MSEVIVSGSFDDMGFADFRFLEEASKRASLHVLLWSDALIAARGLAQARFPQRERQYLMSAVRYVTNVSIIDREDQLPRGTNVVDRSSIPDSLLRIVPPAPATPDNPPAISPTGKKVIVTGCYDYFHSGHLRFFEEAAELGDLYVTVGSDDNIRQLKGHGHPLFPADQRRYIVGSIRFVKLVMIATGMGWLDAEPEIERIKPDIYVVNEDGDKPEKREFCRRKGIEYRVLSRQPRPGLPRRASTVLRGF